MTQALFAICEGLNAPVPEAAARSLSNCRRGDLTEALFIAGCIVYDWETFKAFGHDHTADWVLVRGAFRLTVQVKTARLTDRGDYHINAKRGGGETTRPYAAGDFDVLAMYVDEQDCFTFWTLDELVERGISAISWRIGNRADNWDIFDSFTSPQTSLAVSWIGSAGLPQSVSSITTTQQ